MYIFILHYATVSFGRSSNQIQSVFSLHHVSEVIKLHLWTHSLVRRLSMRLRVSLVRRLQTGNSHSTKACDAVAVPPVGPRHTGGWSQYSWTEVVTLSCTGSASFWHLLHWSVSCFLVCSNWNCVTAGIYYSHILIIHNFIICTTWISFSDNFSWAATTPLIKSGVGWRLHVGASKTFRAFMVKLNQFLRQKWWSGDLCKLYSLLPFTNDISVAVSSIIEYSVFGNVCFIVLEYCSECK